MSKAPLPIIRPSYSSVAGSSQIELGYHAAEGESGELECDVVVIGTGAGGAAAGLEMCLAGKRVIFLEAGPAKHLPDFQKQSLVWSTANIYNQKGLQLATGTKPLLIPSGRVVGGSTVLNSGICFRPPEERLHEWSSLVKSEALKPSAFSPYVEETWKRLGIAPTRPDNGRRNNLIAQKGMAALKKRGIPLHHAFMDRNAPSCMGCGVCHLGCPSGAKASVDRSILPQALELGARIVAQSKVTHIDISGTEAKYVEVRAYVKDPQKGNGKLERDFKIHASHFIVAGSALHTSRLLATSGVENDHLGQHLHLHPGVGVVAKFHEPVHMWNGVPQGYYAIHDDIPNLVFETVNVGPGELFMLFGRAAERFKSNIYEDFKNWSMCGVMLRDEGLGRVFNLPGQRLGMTFELSDNDFSSLKRGLVRLVEMYEAAGAKSIAPMVKPLKFYTSPQDAIRAIQAMSSPKELAHLHASHPHGTARMGADEDLGVVDSTGKVFGLENLYVMDGSLFPSTLGVNPQVTIVALSTMLGRQLAQYI